MAIQVLCEVKCMLEMDSYSPVVVFGYNRPEHFKQTLDALEKCDGAENTVLYIFCDGPKKELTEKMLLVRETAKRVKKKSAFHDVRLFISEVNKGLAQSIIEGVTEIINEYGRVIVLEDDLLCAKSFLRYMNEALERYKNDSLIWSISGYTFPMSSLDGIDNDVYFMGRSSSWGWATWADRWSTIDWTVSDYNTFKFNPMKRRRFARWGGDLPIMLDQQMKSNINSWAIRWCYEQFKQGKMSVYPTISLVQNIGVDGTGTHRGNTSRFNTILDDDETRDFNYVDYYDVPEIRKQCKQQYQGRWQIFIRVYIKNLFTRLGFIK